MEDKKMENVKYQRKEGVQLFINKELELEVRAVEINGEGWLVGKDVAEVLGYSNSRDALSNHVDDEDKASVAIYDGRQNRINEKILTLVYHWCTEWLQM